MWRIQYENCFVFCFLFFLFCFIFPPYSKGIKLSLHVYITITFFFPTLCPVATWVSRQNSQCYSASSPYKSILSYVWKSQSPYPSHSLPLPSCSHKSLLQVRYFLFWGDVHLCFLFVSCYIFYYFMDYLNQLVYRGKKKKIKKKTEKKKAAVSK